MFTLPLGEPVAALALQTRLLVALTDEPRAADQIATAAGRPEEVETVLPPLKHLAANGRAALVDPARGTFARYPKRSGR